MSSFAYAKPMIPNGLLHEMFEIKSGAAFQQDNGGQYIPGKETRISFRGVILPVNDKDLIRDAAGTYMHCTEKIYTNGHALQIGARVMDQDAMDMGELIEKLNAMGERVIFLGDGVPVYEKQIAEKMTVPYDLAPAHVNRQRAASVAALGAVYFAEGKTETAMEHKPDYLRKSQAEREREEREAKNA